MKGLPPRLYICPACRYSNLYRWVLAQHLRNVHGLSKRNSAQIASANEYLANPIHYKVGEVEE